MKFYEKAGLGDEVEIGRSVLNLKKCSDKSSSSVATRKSLFPHLNSLPDAKMSKLTMTCRKTIKRLRAKPKKVRPESFHLAQKFFRQQAVTLPHKRCVSKKTGEVKTFLQQTLRELHCEFLAQKNATLSFSCFAKCRPATVRLLNSVTFNMCLCEYCTNAWLKVTALDKRLNLGIRGEVEAVKTTVCSLDSKLCTHCECSECGVEKFPAAVPDQQMSWHKWEMKEVTFKDKKIKRKVLVTKTGLAADLVCELKKELAFLSKHLFRARFQHARFLQCKKSASNDGVAVMVLDFAENFTCLFQNEVQSAHWHHQQVTVHPTVVYYRCNHYGEIVTESIVAISNDSTHDFHAVHQITKATMDHLQLTRQLELKSVHMWSDGCASQYKSKGPYADLALFWQDFGVLAEKHYFGSRHGKGASDGESAVVKSAATRAIKANQVVISTAEEMFAFCQVRLTIRADGACKHFLRHFVFIPLDSIQRDRTREVMVIKGSQKIHWLQAGKDGTLEGSYLSCCCPGVCSQECRDAVGPKQYFKYKAAVGVHAGLQDGDTQAAYGNGDDQAAPHNGNHQVTHENGGEQAVFQTVNNDDTASAVQEPATFQSIDSQATSQGADPHKKCMDSLICGSWVVAMFPGKKGQKKFLGTSGDHFIWPAVEDISWMPHYALVAIEAPDLDALEHMFLAARAKNMFDC